MQVVLKLTEAIFWIVFVIVALLLIWAALLGLKAGGDDDQTAEGHSTESETEDRH
jgi:uncharacterized membrane protein